MRVVTLCGSHHPASTNAAAIRAMSERLREHAAAVEAIDVDTDIPAFRPLALDEAPEVVKSVRASFERADAVVFAVPEYAGGVPGWVKNITDWLVVSGSLHGRPVAVVSAATMGGRHAIVQLAHTLTWQGAVVVATGSIAAPLTKTDENGKVSDPATRALLAGVADTVVDAIRGGTDVVERLTADALTPLGIDPTDRPT